MRFLRGASIVSSLLAVALLVPLTSYSAAPTEEEPEIDCRASESCKEDGECTFQEGECIATSDADCRASLWCGRAGYCTVNDNACYAASDSDCEGSDKCKRFGECKMERGSCVKE